MPTIVKKIRYYGGELLCGFFPKTKNSVAIIFTIMLYGVVYYCRMSPYSQC